MATRIEKLNSILEEIRMVEAHLKELKVLYSDMYYKAQDD